MKKIPLGKVEKNLFMLIDDEDFERVNQYSWFKDSHGYALTTIPTKEQRPGYSRYLRAHRFITQCPIGFQVDHINHNELDNRKSNLRVVTHQQNLLNKLKTRGRSIYKGVSWWERDKTWMAKISFDYKQIYLGYFKTEEEAAKAYDVKARELFGKYARPNFA